MFKGQPQWSIRHQDSSTISLYHRSNLKKKKKEWVPLNVCSHEKEELLYISSSTSVWQPLFSMSMPQVGALGVWQSSRETKRKNPCTSNITRSKEHLKKKKQSTCVAQRKQTMKDYAPCRFIMCLAVASCSIFSQDSLLIECTCFEFKTRNFSFSPLFELFFFFFSHLLTFGHTFFFFLKLAWRLELQFPSLSLSFFIHLNNSRTR